MSNPIQPHEKFLADVATHAIEVIKDDDLFRHIRFKRPNTMCYHFDLITWPGHLCYTGDMGTYVFRRDTDMFAFFRVATSASKHWYHGIDHHYWAQKLIAIDCHGSRSGSATEFDQNRFRRVINEIRLSWIREGCLPKEQRRALWDAVEDNVLNDLDRPEAEICRSASEFRWLAPADDACDTYQFDELWDYDFKKFTHGFIWCCYAIAWGINQYDLMKASKEVQ